MAIDENANAPATASTTLNDAKRASDLFKQQKNQDVRTVVDGETICYKAEENQIKCHQVPQETKKRLDRLFNEIDVDKKGSIDITDLTVALDRRGHKASKKNAQKLLELSDQDQSGRIDFAEFITYCIEHEKRLQVMFHDIDVNQDGQLDAVEVQNAFKRLGIKIEREEASKLIRKIKKDGTISISFEEWRDYLMLHPAKEITDLMNFWRHSFVLDLGEDKCIPDDFTAQELVTGMWWRHLLAGAVAGAVSRTFTAPLDRLKVFLQVRGSEFASLHLCFRHMLAEGGWRGMWRGNGINILKIAPETALKFMAYEQAKQFIRGAGNRELSMRERFCAGSVAGGISQTVIYPMEVLKTRLCLRKTGQYSGMADAAAKIYQQEGFKAFYRGYLPNLLGILPYAGIDLAIYETLKKWYLRTHSKTEDPGVLVFLACGTVSSSCGQVASYPLALVRTRLQAQVGPTSDNMVGLFKNILAREGVRGLYRGIAPNFMKVAPAVSISYVVYEHTRRQLGATMS